MVLEILGVTAPLFTAFGGWFYGRKKSKADAISVELQNVQTAIAIWRDTAEDLSNKCNELTVEIEALRQENAHLKRDIRRLQQKLNELSNN